MPFKDTVKLAFGHNLVMPNLPDKFDLDKIAEKNVAEHREIESFGLFDTNTANYNTYYPDVTPEDLAPKDSEFVQPVFRALSEVIVHKQYNPIDFSKPGVLKRSMGLLTGSTINVDHEMAVGNAIGAVSKVSWEESYKTDKGIIVPAGINSRLKIDGKSQPRIARAIMMDPPAIHSTSVTVNFEWELSHNISAEEFFKLLGSYDKDGQMYRRITTNIIRYPEISLVGHGADPFAQKINKDGEINNPLWADVSYNSADPKNRKATKYFLFDFKSDIVLNEEKDSIPTESNNNNSAQNEIMNKKFLLALAATFGIKNMVDNKEVDYTEETITEDAVKNAATALQGSVATLNARPNITQAEVTRLQGIETSYNAIKDINAPEVTSLKAFKEDALTKLRAEVKKNLSIISKGKPTPEQTKLVEEGDHLTLTAINTTYLSQIEKDFPLQCKKCNSKEVGRGSALVEGNEGAEGEGNEKLTTEDIQDTLRKKRLQKNFTSLHGQVEKPAATK